ncbi:unnamed protein product [marine sediment metagenome]|uniref:Uncharacterized protein n=1 Tax=marine sediment metagenome TaxID=412755 RepID=X1L1F4_9ZZZZ
MWKDGSFRIHPKQKTKYHGKYCRQAIKDAWSQGFVDIKCIDNMQDTFKDVLKYVTRCLDGGLYTLTNAMVWYFRRQSFGISKDFIKEVWGTGGSIDSAEPSNADENSQLRSNSNRKLIAIEIFPIFPRFYFGYRPQTTLDNYKHPPPWGPYSENFIDNFAATKCDANVKIREDGVAVTTYKLREFEIV